MKDTISIKEFVRLSRSKWKWYACSVAACLALAVLYIIITPKKYTRQAQVVIQEEGGIGGMMGRMGALGDIGGLIGMNLGSSNLYNEMFTMQSPWVLQNVVKAQHLDITYKKGGFPSKELYAETLPLTVDIKLAEPEDDISLRIDLNKSGAVKLYKITKNEDKYDSELTGKVNETFKTPIGDIRIAATPYLKDMDDDEMTIKVYRSSLMSVVEGLKKQKLIFSRQDRDASIINISCTDVFKKRAENIINAIIAEYQRNVDEDKNRQMAASEKYVAERIASLQNEIQSLGNKMADYKSKNMMPDIEIMAKVYAESAKDLSTAQMELNNQLYVVESIRDYLRDESKKDELLPALLITESSGLSDQVSEYNKLQLQRNKIVASSSKNNPMVAEIDKQLAAMHDAVLASANNAITQIRLQLRSVNGKVNEGMQQLSSAPKKAIGSLTDERDWKVLNQIYIFLLQKHEETQMTRGMRTDIRVLTPPMGPKKATSPIKRNILACALLLGIFFPACFIVVREYIKKQM